MLASIRSAALAGITAIEIEVEVDLTRGLFVFSIVGLPASTISESRTRVKSALKNTGYPFPKGRVTVNLAPAHLRKEGTSFDLPIALGILQAQKVIPRESTSKCLCVGELALDGRVRPIRGLVPVAVLAKQLDVNRIYLPKDNIAEAALVNGPEIVGISHLSELVEILTGSRPAHPARHQPLKIRHSESGDLAALKGQRLPRRALEIAAAGAHNILFYGPPGTGKSMLARCAPSILPPMTQTEALETAMLKSVSERFTTTNGYTALRPFRSPHHTVSDAALIGGGQTARPGEISLAHNGVLFLDELPEYRRTSLEALRQPLEDRKVVISRAERTVEYPCSFMLIGAMNPCPCGYLGHPGRNCDCHPSAIQRYHRKLSGPMLDRFDIKVNVGPVPISALQSNEPGESSAVVRKRVAEARRRQRQRSRQLGCLVNGNILPGVLTQHCRLSDDAKRVLINAMEHFQLSARSYHRIQRVAWTIADLDGSDSVRLTHVLEALQLRNSNLTDN